MRRALFTRAFWADAGERAIKTAAQTSLTFFTLSATPHLDASWQTVGAAAGLGALFSVLSSLASAPAPGMSPASLVPPGL
jgi:hypothetical protein